MKRAMLSFSLLLLAAGARAEMSVCGTEELLPIGLTEEELTRLDEIGINTVPTSPPPGGTVNPGEFAPATGVMVRWPLGLPSSLIVALSYDTEVWVICTAGQQGTVESTFSGWGVNMDNVGYIHASTNSIWVRDYGPWFVMLPDGSQGIFNYTYNRPRPDDNNFPVALGSAWGIPVYTSTIEHTGGNYMSSGFGQSMSTDMVYDENGGNEDWVDSQMEVYLGVDDYVTFDDPQSSYIDHIDCWAKMLSPGRVMVLQVPSWHGDYDELEAAADLLAQTESPYGVPWEVYRVYSSSGDEGYTNSLVCNDHVYVPLFDTDNDSAALLAYEQAMPGYTVEGFEYYDWEPTDALHCRTRNVMDGEMLLVRHVPVDTLQPAGQPVEVEALIRCHPDNTLQTKHVLYRFGTTGPFTTVYMSAAGGDSYVADIPGAPSGTTVQYYVSATDDSGRSEQQPRFAPDSWLHDYLAVSTGTGSGPAALPSIGHPAPNPSHGTVSLALTGEPSGPVVLSLYDLSGRAVAGASVPAASAGGSVRWSLPDRVPSGVYMLRASAGEAELTARLVLVR